MTTESAWLDDLRTGAVCALGTVTVSAGEIVAYARQFDPQPFHLDPEAARSTAAGGLIASGWHTASLAMRLIAEGRPFGIAPILGIGVDSLRWPKPVRPGDVLELTAEIVEVKPSASKPDRGMVRVRLIMTNQTGDVVLSMEPMLVVPRRPPLP